MSEYKKETVVELRQELKQREIPSTGLTRKQQIIEKLEENDAEKGADKPEVTADDGEQSGKSACEKTDHKDKHQNVPSKRSAEDTQPEDVKKGKTEQSEEEPEAKKPRLTTPDIEFDWDRSQLRDPRPTPGRVRRPRYEDIDCPEDLKKKFETEFEIPKPEKPPGRLNAMQKDHLYCQEALMNPLQFHHDKQTMQEKGPNGSPTYDPAGFEIDYDKYIHGTTRTYNKQAMIRSMDKAVEKGQTEQDQMFKLFFLPDQQPGDNEAMWVKDYVKDQVSKDLGIPWHQIKPPHLEQWLENGNEKVAFKDWWKEPNEEEKKRMMKMATGSVFRKDL